MRVENEARPHSRATFRYQLIVDVLQNDRASARIVCLDLLPLIEELQADRIIGRSSGRMASPTREKDVFQVQTH